MCFHNAMSAKIKKLTKRYNLKTDIIEIAEEILEETRRYHVNAFAHPECPVITAGNQLRFERWGLIPHWEKTSKDADQIQNMTLNARSETLFEKPSFRTPIRKTRCLIPSTGYFEYHHEGKETTPYFIFLKNEDLFSIGGISDRWQNPVTGVEVETFSLITTPANQLTSWIHNGGRNPGRMPFIIPQALEDIWLNPQTTKEELQAIMQPYPTNEMDAYIIRKDFIKKDPHDPSIVEAI